jgi:hypothetical protein
MTASAPPASGAHPRRLRDERHRAPSTCATLRTLRIVGFLRRQNRATGVESRRGLASAFRVNAIAPTVLADTQPPGGSGTIALTTGSLRRRFRFGDSAARDASLETTSVVLPRRQRHCCFVAEGAVSISLPLSRERSSPAIPARVSGRDRYRDTGSHEVVLAATRAKRMRVSGRTSQPTCSSPIVGRLFLCASNSASCWRSPGANSRPLSSWTIFVRGVEPVRPFARRSLGLGER